MNLHQDKPAFQTLLLNQSERTGIRADILEKDYYVTLILEELANKQKSTPELPAFFKGGTALFKALGTIRRFSEDIDLTVSLEGLISNTQKKKRLEKATKYYESLTRDGSEGSTVEFSGSITTTYTYDSAVKIDRKDKLQRFERVKIEATSFTVSEPHTPIEIAPMILEIASRDEKNILSRTFEVNPFKIETITLERMFIDKVFAAEFYYLRKENFDTAKHLYDLCVLIRESRIKTLFLNHSLLDQLIEYKRIEERDRRGSSLATTRVMDFSYFGKASSNSALKSEFNHMQQTYVFDDKYKISLDELTSGISIIGNHFSKLKK